jgi:hypothetical protein
MLQIIGCTHTHERVCKSCVVRNWAIRTGKRVIDQPLVRRAN